VLALAPGLALAPPSEAAYRDAALGMLRLAWRLNRTLLAPELSLEAPWLREGGPYAPAGPDGPAHRMLDPTLVLSPGNGAAQRAIWIRSLDAACMAQGYLVRPDYEELRRRLPGEGESVDVATAANTAFYAEYAAAAAAAAAATAGNATVGGGGAGVGADEAYAALAPLAGTQVAYLGRPLLAPPPANANAADAVPAPPADATGEAAPPADSADARFAHFLETCGWATANLTWPQNC
jgi:hypothetical protein